MARDKYHDLVRSALEDSGWLVTDDPLRLEIEGRSINIDLGAEKLIGAEKEGKKIAVEVKSFVGHSNITELYHAIGQFEIYEIALDEVKSSRALFLAVPEYIYHSLFQELLAEKAVKRYGIRLIVYSITNLKIVKWIE